MVKGGGEKEEGKSKLTPQNNRNPDKGSCKLAVRNIFTSGRIFIESIKTKQAICSGTHIKHRTGIMRANRK